VRIDQSLVLGLFGFVVGAAAVVAVDLNVATGERFVVGGS
jgi:hypothetical protein